MNFFNEALKWRRERKQAASKAIDESTKLLLNRLAMFRSGDVGQAAHQPQAKTYAETVSAYYDWQIAVSPYLRKEQPQIVKEMQDKIVGREGNPKLYEEAPILADKILEIAHKANQRI